MSQRGQRILLGLLLAGLLLFLLGLAWPFATSFVLASLLAIVMHPANRRLSRRLRRPTLASLVTTLATVIALGTALFFVGLTVVKDTANAYNALNQRSPEGEGRLGMITHTTDRIVDVLATRLPMAKEAIRAELLAGMKVGARYLLSKTRAAIEGMTSIAFTSVMATIFLYYLLRYGESWVRRAAALVPLSPHITANLLRVAHQSIVANVNGVLVVALAQGSFLGLGFWFVGIGSPLLWGMFGAIASIVPFVGPTLIWVPAVIGFVFMGSYWKALELGLWGGLVVGSLDNILRPLIVGVGEKQHPVLVGFAMLGGTYALGPLGLLFGPLLVSLTGAVVEEIHRTGPAETQTPRSQEPGVRSQEGNLKDASPLVTADSRL
jgi:predicted PurR-regulated permease PerM